MHSAQVNDIRLHPVHSMSFGKKPENTNCPNGDCSAGAVGFPGNRAIVRLLPEESLKTRAFALAGVQKKIPH